MSPELSAVTFFKSGSSKDLVTATDTMQPWEMISLSEIKAGKIISSNVEPMVKFTQRHIIRTYPKGVRINSSNYDPTPFWAFGSQFVALNYQTFSDPMLLNDAKFRENGNCGYLLKPTSLLTFASPQGTPVPKTPPVTLRIFVLSARQLPKATGKQSQVVDPFVTINIFGAPPDACEKKSKPIPNNGFNPLWNEAFQFTLASPDVDMVSLSVVDRDTNRIIAQYALPVSCIRQGYRVVPLLDEQGSRLPGCDLLCNFSLLTSR
eukprot:TRINITY_DN23504_c0_g1_i1.p1 TRINITY_DN23504_c0_g1~~TRINITY_DN23504_c0_g1_i1.p1  ORF type:complete len:263 (+),score=46.46 TRINITY_DN23504_c0_g1_i1:349-1137(+)